MVGGGERLPELTRVGKLKVSQMTDTTDSAHKQDWTLDTVYPDVVGTIVAAGILPAVEPRHPARRMTRTD